MIERADQLVLNYVSKAADAAHGVLRADQRLDFAKRLRARIEAERRGSQNAREVSKVLARFGDPVALVEREARRLAEAGVPTMRAEAGVPTTRAAEEGPPAQPSGAPSATQPSGARSMTQPSGGPSTAQPSGDERSTRRFPTIVDDADAPPGVQTYRRIAQESLGRGRGLPFAGLRRVAMSSANPMATGGRDARTLVKEHPRDAAAMVILVVAALLLPFDLPPVAIFEIPVLVWAAGAVLVLFSDTWSLRDKLLGIGAPLLGYSVGGVLVGGLRVGSEPGLQAFFAQFYSVSGTMFMIGTGLGVVWLAYRLLDLN
ncbi:PT domain-containing protein [Nonomuraea sp. JJY05]|uniref:PT domain-containing protein n=1 Tax=Nonomuraea sp. JJY05 TaxID=3350255 RepID=UPI00373EBA36